MRALKGERLLDAWERGAGQSDLVRALMMLAVGYANRTWEDLASLSMSQRDVELLRLRRMTFGDALRGFMPCAACSARVEFEASVTALLERLEALLPPDESTWHTENLTFSMRPVTTRDLGAIPSALDSRMRLLARCTSVEGHDVESVLAAHETVATEHFNRLNEGAETRFKLSCPVCGATYHAELDIARFFWAEVRHAAVMALREVHDLASVYGWTEASILRMNSPRRRMYLEMARI